MEQDDEHDRDGAETLDVGTETPVLWRGARFVARELEAFVGWRLVANHHLRCRDLDVLGG